jgi:hypothetical protein
LAEDPQNLASAYRLFAVTNQDDYRLMLWMRENLSRQAVVLVNPYEPGLFIPTVSYHKLVFPYSGSQLSSGYQRLVKLITQNLLNATAYSLMARYNITHVFVGHESTYWWEHETKWDQNAFLGNPNFRLSKGFGGSYLFQLSYHCPEFVFLDDFDYINLVANGGWTTSSKGCGSGEAETAFLAEGDFLVTNSSHETEETALHSYFYELSVGREIYLWETSNVTLFFGIGQSSGLGDLDAFAFVISNTHLNRSIVIATPDGIYQVLDPNGSRTYTMENFTGSFSLNLSNMWEQVYNATLPTEMYLQVRNVDFDGVPNVVSVDFIEVLCDDC